jgi:hypothetical protein
MERLTKIKMKQIINISVLIAGVFVLTSCYYDVEEQLYPGSVVCDNTNVTFALTIEPLIVSKCLGCHNNNVSSGSISLEGYANIKTQADNGNLLGTVSHASGFSAMPKNEPKLPDCQIESIQIWITNGAQND